MAANLAYQFPGQMTEEEYLAFERASDIRHEYRDGYVYAMAGATREHNLITGNVFGELRDQLRGKPCETYSSEMKVRIPRTGSYNYPDVVGVCGKPALADGHRDVLLNPLVVEVLSPSTEARDQSEKFREYRSIESFAEYVLIAQERPSADHFVKQGGVWTILEVEEEIEFVHVPCTLRFPDIYERVEFPAPAQPTENEGEKQV
jgi:Uma2 family endonuclease